MLRYSLLRHAVAVSIVASLYNCPALMLYSLQGYQRIWAPHIGEKATTLLLLLHVVSNFALMEGRGSISNCASSAEIFFFFFSDA